MSTAGEAGPCEVCGCGDAMFSGRCKRCRYKGKIVAKVTVERHWPYDDHWRTDGEMNVVLVPAFAGAASCNLNQALLEYLQGSRSSKGTYRLGESEGAVYRYTGISVEWIPPQRKEVSR